MKICPQCQGRGKITDSRPLKEYTRRRYHCACGHSWTTAEFLVSEGADRSRDKVKAFRLRETADARAVAAAELRDVLRRFEQA